MNKLLLAAIVLFCFAVTAKAEERILDFTSYIKINPDSSLDVVEIIRVQSDEQQIKHGIYRDFPTRYRDKYDRISKAEFELTGIERDGQAEQYHIKNISGGKRIYLGSANINLPAGIYTYSIAYRTSGWLGHFENYDELYWNVTGNDWAFPIENATAIIRLPQGATLTQSAAYTGVEGAKGADYKQTISQSGDVTFKSTHRLNSYEGLTVAVAFPKGFVVEKEAAKPNFWRDNRGVMIALVFLITLALYYYRVWDKVGRDPKKGTIIPLFAPPDNLSPAQCGYVYNMQLSQKFFSAAIVNMAVKGYLKISGKGDNTFLLRKIGTDDSNLADEERKISENLFDGSDEIFIGKVNTTKVRNASDEMRSSLENRWKKANFANNFSFKYLFVGLGLSVFAMAGVYLQFSDSGGIEGLKINGEDSTVGPAFWFISIWSFFSIGIFCCFLAVLKRIVTGKKGLIPIMVFLLLFVVGFFGSELYMLYQIALSTGILTSVIIFSLYFINFIMPSLLKAPTVEGRALMDKIEGFKMYFNVAEKDRLNALNPPSVTPQVFEKYLPYAMALGLEQEWGQKFTSEVSSIIANNYQPDWYSGNDFSSSNFNSFSNSFSSGISSSISQPSSDGGSSGGGSSGRGGGGGGGGGW